MTKQANIVFIFVILLADRKRTLGEYTFSESVKLWKDYKCIFPDPSTYDVATTLDLLGMLSTESANTVPFILRDCQNISQADESDSLFKYSLCQVLFDISKRFCVNVEKKPKAIQFVQQKLNPQAINSAIDFNNISVCSVAALVKYTPLDFMKDHHCANICESAPSSTKDNLQPLCRLVVTALYQYYQPLLTKTNTTSKSDHSTDSDGDRTTFTKPPISTFTWSATPIKFVSLPAKSSSSNGMASPSSSNAPAAPPGKTPMNAFTTKTVISSKPSLGLTSTSAAADSATVTGGSPTRLTHTDPLATGHGGGVGMGDITDTRRPSAPVSQTKSPSPPTSHIPRVMMTHVNQTTNPVADGKATLLPATVGVDDRKADLFSADSGVDGRQVNRSAAHDSGNMVTDLKTMSDNGDETGAPAGKENGNRNNIPPNAVETKPEENKQFFTTDASATSTENILRPNTDMVGTGVDDQNIHIQATNMDGAANGQVSGTFTASYTVKAMEKPGLSDMPGKSLNRKQGGGEEDKHGSFLVRGEESPGSGHFFAYFLTAVVICISGYVIFHNKQKILAFVVEGRSGLGGERRRSSNGVQYTQLKSNVEEVMPSLDKATSSKNFVY